MKAIFGTFFVILILNPISLSGQEKINGHYDPIPYFSCLAIETILEQDIIKWYLPINTKNRKSLENVQLTSIGQFGLKRAARPGIPAHLHTGADFKRPNNNYVNEPIFPAAKGKVISLRDDGPFAQIIIQHTLPDSNHIWTVYEHIAGIQTKLNHSVDPLHPIARFMTRNELDRYGWQFDHVHFEIMKTKPKPRRPDKKRPFLHYGTYSLVCFNQSILDKYYFSPLEFFSLKWDTGL